MSYKITREVHKVTPEMIVELEKDYPFAKNVFKAVDSIEVAVEKIVTETNRKLPTQECVTNVLESIEDAEKGVYRITMNILD